MAPGFLSRFGAGLFSTSIYSNYLWSILNLVLSKGLRFAGILVCIRLVGTLTWGEITSTLVIVGFMAFLVDQGLNESPQVYRVHERGLDLPLIFKISLYRLGMACLVIACLHLSRLVSSLPSPLVLAYAFVLIPRSLNIDWFFHRRERYHLTMVINSFRAVLFFGMVALLVRKGSPAKTVILIEIASEASGLIFSYILAGWSGLRNRTERIPLSLRHLLRFSAPMLLTTIVGTVPASIDIIFLKFFSGNEAIGQYDIGGKIGSFYFFTGATLIQIILPKLARLHASASFGKIEDILGSSSKILLVLTSLLLVPSFFFPSEIMTLIFKKNFPLAVYVFQWIPVWVYLSCMTMLNSIVLLATGRRREYFYGAVLCASTSLVGNWILISQFSGKGAVMAKILAESVFLAYSLAKLPPEIKARCLRNMGLQLGNLILLIGLFVLSTHLGERGIFLALSLGFCLAVVVHQRTFSRKTLASLMEN